jgi:hypothetical protein
MEICSKIFSYVSQAANAESSNGNDQEETMFTPPSS